MALVVEGMMCIHGFQDKRGSMLRAFALVEERRRKLTAAKLVLHCKRPSKKTGTRILGQSWCCHTEVSMSHRSCSCGPHEVFTLHDPIHFRIFVLIDASHQSQESSQCTGATRTWWHPGEGRENPLKRPNNHRLISSPFLDHSHPQIDKPEAFFGPCLGM